MKFTADEIRAVMRDQTYPLTTKDVASAAARRYGRGEGYGDPKEVRAALDELLVAGTVISARRAASNEDTNPEHGYLIRYSGRDVWWMDTARAVEFKAAMIELDERRKVVTAKTHAVVEALDPDGPPADNTGGWRDARYAVKRNDHKRAFTIELTLTEDKLDRLVEALGLSTTDAPQAADAA